MPPVPRHWCRLVWTASLLFISAAGVFADGPFKFHPVNPCRLIDTRLNPGVPLTSGPAYHYQVVGHCGVPVAAKAVFLNIVSVAPTAQGFIAAYPSPGPFPGISIVNINAGERALANGAVVPLSADPNYLGKLTATYGTCCGGTSHLVLEIMGYFR